MFIAMISQSHPLSYPSLTDATSAGRSSASGLSATACLAGAATPLLIAQLLIGTAPYFAVAVYVSLLVVILTLRVIGFATIAGVLIGYFAFRYLVLSQVFKTLYGQPGQTNLAAPETTIFVLLVGITAMCAAAVVVSVLQRDRKVISLDFSPSTLTHVRNICFAIGFIILLSTGGMSSSESGEAQYGGLVGVIKQFSSLSYFAVMAETWRTLKRTDGKVSVSPSLVFMLAALSFVGLTVNSKFGVAQPFIAYLLASVAFRRRISRRQIAVSAFGAVLFIGAVYPIIHILRAYNDRADITMELSSMAEFVSESLADPSFIFRQWDQLKATPDDTVYAQGLYYLGSSDDLLGRFLLIANTDTIVSAVNHDGPYGMGLVLAGIDSSIPHFLSPDKLQNSTGDIVTWYYGLRRWGMIGYPANGLLADCYAALGWAGVVIIPFVLLVLLLGQLQLAGQRIAGNLLGAFLLLINLHSFGEANIQQYITTILRGLPQYLFAIVASTYFVNALLGRHRVRATRPTP